MIQEENEYYTFENILKRMLEKIPNDIDKREGSIIYNALAPAAAELAQIYIVFRNNMDLVFVDTAVSEYLDRIVNQIGMKREPATKAIKEATFYDENDALMDVPVNSRFTCGEYYWSVLEKIDTGKYKIEAELAGNETNSITGRLIPVEYIVGLGTATLGKILIPGEDEESDEELRERYIENTKAPAFAGNVTDYRTQVKAIKGVGDLKVIPVWNGGGTVKLIILDSNYSIPTEELINQVQEIIYPSEESNSIGLAPIGHNVTVVGATTNLINITTNITLQDDYASENVKEEVKIAIEEYLLSLRKKWATSENIIVRIAQLETRILGVEGVLDIANTTINSQTSNIQLNSDVVPITGTVVVNVE